MYEKTIIEFGIGKISWSIRPGAMVDDSDFCFNNLWYYAKTTSTYCLL